MAGIGRFVTGIVGRRARVMLLLGLLLAVSCVPMAEVVQGQVTAVERDGAVIRVRNEREPGAPPLVIDISGAEVGATPVPGDEVRVAYRTEDGVNRAVRVMNVTRDRERQKSGH